jgi:elongation factor 4
MDVFKQRLEQEHGASVIVTAPTVPVRVKKEHGDWIDLENPADFPIRERIRGVLEPTILATIVLPSEALGSIMTLCQQRRGELEEHANTAANRVMLRYVLPLSELGGDFYDELKSLSSGYASFDYEPHDMRPADLVRMDILINGEPVDALARIVHRSRADKVGRDLCEVLKGVIARQQFDIAIQAAASGRIVARETIKAYRKNVLSKCYGGDVSRKRKLLEKQKAGKKRMRQLGSNVQIETQALHTVMQTR